MFYCARDVKKFHKLRSFAMISLKSSPIKTSPFTRVVLSDMCIKTNVARRKLVTSLHSAAAVKHISKASFRTARWPINLSSRRHLYNLVNKTLCMMDSGKQRKHSWRKSLRWPLSCWYVPSVRNGSGSSRSWRSDLSVQDGSLIFEPVQRCLDILVCSFLLFAVETKPLHYTGVWWGWVATSKPFVFFVSELSCCGR